MGQPLSSTARPASVPGQLSRESATPSWSSSPSAISTMGAGGGGVETATRGTVATSLPKVYPTLKPTTKSKAPSLLPCIVLISPRKLNLFEKCRLIPTPRTGLPIRGLTRACISSCFYSCHDFGIPRLKAIQKSGTKHDVFAVTPFNIHGQPRGYGEPVSLDEVIADTGTKPDIIPEIIELDTRTTG